MGYNVLKVYKNYQDNIGVGKPSAFEEFVFYDANPAVDLSI